ncbi:MAG: ComEC/Rec2 family competence protein [Bacillota bacterium]
MVIIKKNTFFIALFLILLIIVSFYFQKDYIAPCLEIHFLNIGQGDSIIIRSHNNYVALIDGGLPQSENRFYLNRYLKAKSISKINALILSHPHKDHLGGFLSLFDEFMIDSVFMTEAEHSSQLYHNWLKTLEFNKPNLYFPKRGDIIKIGDLTFDVIHPDDINSYSDLNSTSISLILNYKGLSSLFSGDIEESAEYSIINSGLLKKIDILKVAHHGSDTSTQPEFIKQTLPDIAVISVGENNFNHPSEKTINNLKENNINIFRTDKDGDVVFYWFSKQNKLYLIQ